VTRIRPLRDFGSKLLSVEKPSRYLGGEYGSVYKDGDTLLTIALCFPDLYEIGMSNNAIRILYAGLNALPGVRCERVFAPAPDFEELLARTGIPLYTLESGIPLHDVDIIGFSLGYELAATSLLTVLGSGGVPIEARERGDTDPIVIAGGPAATNPHPYSHFLDAAYIGEAESTFFELASALSDRKAAGAGRRELLLELSSAGAIWIPARDGRGGKKAKRAIFSGFARSEQRFAFPIPTVKIVQDHGTVEIMRGCPNGCRFCHAGYYYRPQRSKPYRIIQAEVESLVREGGYREITLASLSSGDYPGVSELLQSLNAEWAQQRISFQLPSLKVNSFTLPLIKSLSEVRKSGLTFAVETPCDEWQWMINKDVSFEQTLAILEEAKSNGFKQAKFYFMLGLPVTGSVEEEASAIIGFFEKLFSKIDFQVNVNVGTFVPKPHTPFQWAAQAGEDAAMAAINAIRAGLRRYRNIKLSYHSPFASLLEGVIARGDERVGTLIRRAYDRGARLDAWEEHLNRGLWREILEGVGEWKPIEDICAIKSVEAPLPWDDIQIQVSKSYLLEEYNRSRALRVTSACAENCTSRCGACSDEVSVVENITHQENEDVPMPSIAPIAKRQEIVGRMILRLSKHDTASYLQHLSVIDALARALQMIEFPSAFSEGFNPMPRIEIGQPLPIAVESECEIASIYVTSEVDSASTIQELNMRLPRGLRVEEGCHFPVRAGIKQRTIGSLSWGSKYQIKPRNDLLTSFIELSLTEYFSKLHVEVICKRSTDDTALDVVIPDSKSREQSLFRALESCTDIRPIQSAFSILRNEHYADAGDGPESFFEALGKISGQPG